MMLFPKASGKWTRQLNSLRELWLNGKSTMMISFNFEEIKAPLRTEEQAQQAAERDSYAWLDDEPPCETLIKPLTPADDNSLTIGEQVDLAYGQFDLLKGSTAEWWDSIKEIPY